MKKVCKHTHWEPVGVDNGAADYCMKEETRVPGEGPWEFGKKPLHQNVKGECTQARAEKNALIMEKSLDELQTTGEISICQVPMLKRAKDIIMAERAEKEVKRLKGKLHEHNVWFYGPEGIGKTGWAIDYFTDNGGYYQKDKSKYWNNYGNQPNITVNDRDWETIRCVRVAYL